MSQKKVGQVRGDRFFKIGDIFIYGAIAVIVAALFLAIFLTGDRSALTVVEGRYNNAVAFSYDFTADELSIYLPQNVAVDEFATDDGGITIIFCTDGGSLEELKSYNIIYIDRSARSVTVTESDCSSRRDCVYTPAITDNSGVIVCTPHALTISPSGFSDINGTLPIG